MLNDMIVELKRIFAFFNERYYDSALIDPIITVQTNLTRRQTMGWCTVREVWVDSENSKAFFEINICPEFLNLPIEETYVTMLHEMVHLFCKQNQIKDVSRGGTYHNKIFKKVAETKGLNCDYSKKNGWSITTLNEATVSLLSEMNTDTSVFKLSRTYHLSNNEDSEETEDADDGSKSKKTKTRKYACPQCKARVNGPKSVHIICGKCNLDMVLLNPEVEEDSTGDNSIE